ncbi:hypothetical protein P280DRAFT_474794 [Massarina eburnea CBS 473.64]|uniref:Microbial-type PARG catalytic domain-containing protein n=1 Tax=Massarina eburnea CBS 473.64 TaxID=1395130 RepID=A0A6A6RGV9_9PLEO|nr:hypothetical protein P280DRAFT_474794 [Massarina eburnea CBS 473.64]
MASSNPITHYFKKPSTKPHTHNDERRETLRRTALETRAALPRLLSQYRMFNPQAATQYHLSMPNQVVKARSINIPPLDPLKCPGYKLSPDSNAMDTSTGAGTGSSERGTRIRVINGDTLDTASSIHRAPTVTEIMDTTFSPPPSKPVLVLNLANALHAGGGWQNGAMAQEEELCYRTTLSVSLHRHLYPFSDLSCIYSPNVVLFRSSYSTGHTQSPTHPLHLPVYSVLSIAGLYRPALSPDGTSFANNAHRDVTKAKIRLVLRVAAAEGHSRVVLGALGCGVFLNPPAEVAKLFLSVLSEQEFSGGWWEDLVFAVLDNAPQGKGGKDGPGNFGVFYRALHDRVV